MSDNLLNELERFKSTYYADNKKNSVFKAAQKTDLANRVCEQFGLTELFKRTSFIIPGTNKVYINYPTLKTFVNASNYEEFANYTQSLFVLHAAVWVLRMPHKFRYANYISGRAS
jgi:hypothetical protein